MGTHAASLNQCLNGENENVYVNGANEVHPAVAPDTLELVARARPDFFTQDPFLWGQRILSEYRDAHGRIARVWGSSSTPFEDYLNPRPTPALIEARPRLSWNDRRATDSQPLELTQGSTLGAIVVPWLVISALAKVPGVAERLRIRSVPRGEILALLRRHLEAARVLEATPAHFGESLRAYRSALEEVARLREELARAGLERSRASQSTRALQAAERRENARTSPRVQMIEVEGVEDSRLRVSRPKRASEMERHSIRVEEIEEQVEQTERRLERAQERLARAREGLNQVVGSEAQVIQHLIRIAENFAEVVQERPRLRNMIEGLERRSQELQVEAERWEAEQRRVLEETERDFQEAELRLRHARTELQIGPRAERAGRSAFVDEVFTARMEAFQRRNREVAAAERRVQEAQAIYNQALRAEGANRVIERADRSAFARRRRTEASELFGRRELEAAEAERDVSDIERNVENAGINLDLARTNLQDAHAALRAAQDLQYLARSSFAEAREARARYQAHGVTVSQRAEAFERVVNVAQREYSAAQARYQEARGEGRVGGVSGRSAQSADPAYVARRERTEAQRLLRGLRALEQVVSDLERGQAPNLAGLLRAHDELSGRRDTVEVSRQERRFVTDQLNEREGRWERDISYYERERRLRERGDREILQIRERAERSFHVLRIEMSQVLDALRREEASAPQIEAFSRASEILAEGQIGPRDHSSYVNPTLAEQRIRRILEVMDTCERELLTRRVWSGRGYERLQNASARIRAELANFHEVRAQAGFEVRLLEFLDHLGQINNPNAAALGNFAAF